MQALRRLSVCLKDLKQRIYDRHSWILLLVLTAGLLLRIWGITFGLPFEYHVDERPYLSAAWPLEGGLQSGQLVLSGPLSLLVFVEHKLLQFFAPLMNSIDFPSYFDLSGATSQTVFIVLGRLTSAILGTATAIPVYLMGKKLWDKKVGLISALFLTLFFLNIRDSHYGTPDVTGAFLVAMTVYFCTLFSPDRGLRYYVLAGVFAGLAISTRLTTLLLFVPIVLYHAFPVQQGSHGRSTTLDQGNLRSPDKLSLHVSEIWRWFWADVLTWRLALVSAVAGLTFVATQPHLVLHPLDYAREVKLELELGHLGGFGRFQIDNAPGWVFYLKTLRWGIGDLLLMLALGGITMAFIRRSRYVVFLLSFPLLYFVVMGRTGHVFARYAMPLLPFLALAAAEFLRTVVSWIRAPGRYATLLTLVLMLIAVAQPVHSSLRHDVLLTRKDSRTVAKEWIEEHIPEGSSILLEWHTPPLATATNPVPFSRRSYRIEGTSVYGLSDHPLDYYEQQGIEYLITSSFISDIRMVLEGEDSAKRAFYQSLDREAELIAEFRPYSGEDKPPFVFAQIYGPATSLSQFDRPGPVIKVYRMSQKHRDLSARLQEM